MERFKDKVYSKGFFLETRPFEDCECIEIVSFKDRGSHYDNINVDLSYEDAYKFANQILNQLKEVGFKHESKS